MRTSPSIVLALTATLLMGCGASDEGPRVPVPDAPSGPTVAPTTPPPAASQPASQPTAPPASAPSVPMPPKPTTGLTFPDVEDWDRGEPSNSMRVAQYVVPGSVVESDDATVVVFYFGKGQGGSAEANIQRWGGQFTRADGSDPVATGKRSTGKLNGRQYTQFETTGSFVAEMPPGSGNRVNHADWKLVATIIDSEFGSYYIKFVGPITTVDRWADSYQEFLRAIE